jgi:hypothetical protein
MQTHTAQQITKDGPCLGKWVYTGGNDREGRYIECCRDEHGALLPDDQLGHDTREEAYEHQRQRLLPRLRLDGQLGEWSGCRVCDAPTKGYAEIPPMHFMEPLCDEHRTREYVESKFQVGDSYGSY